MKYEVTQTIDLLFFNTPSMAAAHQAASRHPTQRHTSRALPYYFYVVGVLAALGAAALLVSAEAQGKMPAALGGADVLLVVPSENC